MTVYENTLLGRLGVRVVDGAVAAVYFDTDAADPDATASVPGPLHRQAFAELREYLDGRRRAFSVPLAPHGTPFQLAVWEKLVAIPYGRTLTYGELARDLGRPGAARAVGSACGSNPLPLLVPCHRVVGSDGKLTGFRGGVEFKRRLLDMEKDVCLAAGGRRGK